MGYNIYTDILQQIFTVVTLKPLLLCTHIVLNCLSNSVFNIVKVEYPKL